MELQYNYAHNVQLYVPLHLHCALLKLIVPDTHVLSDWSNYIITVAIIVISGQFA